MSETNPESLATAPGRSLTRSMSDATTLDQIPKGQIALVLEVVGDDPIARRLGDLGIRKGVEIEVLRRAPLGDPTVFELFSYQLCLRRSESARVHVRAHAKAPDKAPDEAPPTRPESGRP
jgi:ferrous iron transport protein A